jgi:hypothetical protein
MSYVKPSKLKGNSDPTLSFFTSTLVFTTSVLTIDSLNQFGAYIKSFRIVNLDNGNAVTFRQGTTTDPSKTIPPNSENVSDGWESFVQITPNAVSGNGYIELDLVAKSDAEK